MEKDDLYKTLDRTIGFINFCDTKAAVSLATIGVILTIFFSDSNIKVLKDMATNIYLFKNKVLINIYLFIACISLFFLLNGIYNLVLVLVPRLQGSNLIKYDSNIFFEKISIKSYEKFKEDVVNASNEELLEDLRIQIFNNSIICSKKYKFQKIGIIRTLIGILGWGFIYISAILFF